MFITIEPIKELEPFISYYYIMEKRVDDLTLQEPELLMPSGTSIMGFHYSGNWVCKIKNNTSDKITLPDFYTVGQQTVSYTLTISQTTTGIIGATLKPSALWHWLKKPVAFLVNKAVPSQVLFGERFSSIANTIKNSRNHEQRIELLNTFYMNLVSQTDYKPGLVEVALDEIFKNKGCVNIQQLLSRTGFKERSLQKAFKNQVGISPMQYARIIRFNNIFVEISKKNDEHDLSFLSLFYNYYDASHLNKDFKNYCGEAPSTFLIEKFRLLHELVKDKPYLIQVQH